MLVKVQFRKEISLQVFISRKIYTENEFYEIIRCVE